MTKLVLILWQLLTRSLIILEFGILLLCIYLGISQHVFVEMGVLLLMGLAGAVIISAPFFFFSISSIYRFASGDTRWYPFRIGTVDSSDLMRQELGLLFAIAVPVFPILMSWGVIH